MKTFVLSMQRFFYAFLLMGACFKSLFNQVEQLFQDLIELIRELLNGLKNNLKITSKTFGSMELNTYLCISNKREVDR